MHLFTLCVQVRGQFAGPDFGLEFRFQGLAARAFVARALLPVSNFLFLFSSLTRDVTLRHVAIKFSAQ